jgi:hypothetical protein
VNDAADDAAEAGWTVEFDYGCCKVLGSFT